MFFPLDACPFFLSRFCGVNLKFPFQVPSCTLAVVVFWFFGACATIFVCHGLPVLVPAFIPPLTSPHNPLLTTPPTGEKLDFISTFSFHGISFFMFDASFSYYPSFDLSP